MATTTPSLPVIPKGADGALLSAHNCYADTITDLAKSVARDLKRVLIVETAYLRATDTRGERIRTAIVGTPLKQTTAYPYALNVDAGHLAGALELLARWFEGETLELIGFCDSASGRGFLFTFAYR